MSGMATWAFDVWLLFAVNFLGFILGAFITGLSYYAYRSSDRKSSLRNATIGFALLTVGTAIEPTFQLLMDGAHIIESEHYILLQLFDGSIISLGFLVLFFSIYTYNSRPERTAITMHGVDDELFEGPD